ncbi:MAG: OsmC family protein [Phycisphaeraceae bacterium]
MDTTTSKKMLNGLDVDGLNELINTVKANKDAGSTHWHVNTVWAGGARSESHVDGFEIGGKQVDRRFTLKVDEPVELGGSNTAANPQEHLLTALNTCMLMGYVAGATLFGIELSKLEIQTEGDIDLRGFLGIDPKAPNGYTELHYTVYIAGNGTPEQFQRLHKLVQATSPNYWNLARPVQLNADLIVE